MLLVAKDHWNWVQKTQVRLKMVFTADNVVRRAGVWDEAVLSAHGPATRGENLRPIRAVVVDGVVCLAVHGDSVGDVGGRVGAVRLGRRPYEAD